MKILHVSKFYPPYRGGIEDVCYNIVRALQDKEQKVICFNDKKQDDISFIDGVEIIRIGMRFEFASQPISLSYYKRLKNVIDLFSPDVIHLHLPNPLICIYILKLIPQSTKLVVHWHSDIIAQKYLYQLFRPIENKILNRANVILATSPQYLEDSIPLKPFQNKCKILPNPISLEKLCMASTDYEKINLLQKKYNNKKIIFFMGRHVPYKGIEYLIDAEKYIQSDCIILIAGQGPLTKSLKLRSHSDRIKFIGRIPDEDIKLYMHAASIFAFPSITKNEAFGVVLAEAMYCKATPVCFTIKGSGVNWVNIDQQTGLEVKNKDAIAYAKAIDGLLSNETLRVKLGENAHKRVEDLFTMNVIEKQIKTIYQDI